MGQPMAHGKTTRRGWFLPVALVAIAAIVAVVVLVQRNGDDDTSGPGTSASSSATPRSSAATGTAGRIAQFSGDRTVATKTFKAAANWEVRWTAPAGSGFVIELLTAQGTSRGEIVTAGKKASGSTFVSEKGEFKLNVTSSKPWTIQIFGRPLT